jgi:hypothetical protein
MYALAENPEWTLTDLATKLSAWEADVEEEDVAALDESLFGVGGESPRFGSDESFTFEYRAHRVTIRADGWVHVAARSLHPDD